jgi:hypothetical protein
MDFTDGELVLANVVRFLIDGKQTTEAHYLLVSSIENISLEYSWNSNEQGYSVYLRCPRFVYEILTEQIPSDPFDASVTQRSQTYTTINRAFKAVLSSEYSYFGLIVRPELIATVTKNWREEMIDYLRKGNVHNQVAENEPVVVWNNLRFRSKTERVIAEELDKRGILFFPNCMVRLGAPANRTNREPDFLICHKGKWGILEVDGEPFHTSAAKDHDRDRLFKQHGIKVIERYDAHRCYNSPSLVVDEFLLLLDQA